MTLKTAYVNGIQNALMRLKIALPLAHTMGADHGVMPTGPEMSHGTEKIPYIERGGANPVPEHLIQSPLDASSLWDSVSYNSRVAPGSSGGQFGDETIG